MEKLYYTFNVVLTPSRHKKCASIFPAQAKFASFMQCKNISFYKKLTNHQESVESIQLESYVCNVFAKVMDTSVPHLEIQHQPESNSLVLGQAVSSVVVKYCSILSENSFGVRLTDSLELPSLSGELVI